MIGVQGAIGRSRYRAAGLALPPQAVAAGFVTTTFFDDFKDTTTVAGSAGVTSGKKWYWAGGGVSSTSDYSVNTTNVPGVFDSKPTATGSVGTLAASGGILTISTTHNTFSAGLASVFQGQTAFAAGGCFNHGYIEAYLQFSSIVLGAGGPSGGWPAFWLWAIEGLGANVTAGQITAECDIMEYFPSGTANGTNTGTYIATMHNWQNTSGAAAGVDDFNTNSHHVGSNQPSDSGWHKFGVLWTGNGSTGTIQYYMDDVLQNLQGQTTFTLTAKASDPTAGLSAQEQDHMFIYLGSASIGWPINFDWVRVLQ